MSGLAHSALSIVLQHLLRKNVESEIATTAQKQAELRRRIVESNVCQILYPETFPRDNREDQKANMTEYVEKQYAMNPFHADYNIFRKLEIFIQQSVSFRSLLNPLTARELEAEGLTVSGDECYCRVKELQESIKRFYNQCYAPASFIVQHEMLSYVQYLSKVLFDLYSAVLHFFLAEQVKWCQRNSLIAHQMRAFSEWQQKISTVEMAIYSFSTIPRWIEYATDTQTIWRSRLCKLHNDMLSYQDFNVYLKKVDDCLVKDNYFDRSNSGNSITKYLQNGEIVIQLQGLVTHARKWNGLSSCCIHLLMLLMDFADSQKVFRLLYDPLQLLSIRMQTLTTSLSAGGLSANYSTSSHSNQLFFNKPAAHASLMQLTFQDLVNKSLWKQVLRHIWRLKSMMIHTWLQLNRHKYNYSCFDEKIYLLENGYDIRSEQIRGRSLRDQLLSQHVNWFDHAILTHHDANNAVEIDMELRKLIARLLLFRSDCEIIEPECRYFTVHTTSFPNLIHQPVVLGSTSNKLGAELDKTILLGFQAEALQNQLHNNQEQQVDESMQKETQIRIREARVALLQSIKLVLECSCTFFNYSIPHETINDELNRSMDFDRNRQDDDDDDGYDPNDMTTIEGDDFGGRQGMLKVFENDIDRLHDQQRSYFSHCRQLAIEIYRRRQYVLNCLLMNATTSPSSAYTIPSLHLQMLSQASSFLQNELTIPMFTQERQTDDWVNLLVQGSLIRTRCQVTMAAVNLWRDMFQRYMPADNISSAAMHVDESRASSTPTFGFTCLEIKADVLFMGRLISSTYRKLNEIWHYQCVNPCFHEVLLLNAVKINPPQRKEAMNTQGLKVIQENCSVFTKLFGILETLSRDWWNQQINQESTASMTYLASIESALCTLAIALDHVYTKQILNIPAHRYRESPATAVATTTVAKAKNARSATTIASKNSKMQSDESTANVNRDSNWTPFSVVHDISYDSEVFSAFVVNGEVSQDLVERDFDSQYAWMKKPFVAMSEIVIFMELFFMLPMKAYFANNIPSKSRTIVSTTNKGKRQLPATSKLALSSDDVSLSMTNERNRQLWECCVFWLGSYFKILLLQSKASLGIDMFNQPEAPLQWNDKVIALRLSIAQTLRFLESDIVELVVNQQRVCLTTVAASCATKKKSGKSKKSVDDEANQAEFAITSEITPKAESLMNSLAEDRLNIEGEFYFLLHELHQH